MSSSWPALRAQLAGRIDRHDQHLHFLAIRSRQPELARFPDIGALIAFQHRSDPNHGDRNAVLRALVTEAQGRSATSETAATLVVLALWPGLDAVHGRLLRHYRGEADLLATDLVGGIATGIARLDLGRVTWIAATLLRNIERNLKRARIRERRNADHADFDEAFADPTADCTPGRMLEQDLRRIAGDDADLVIAIAFGGETQREAAIRLGIGYAACRKRYQRALRRLRAALAE